MSKDKAKPSEIRHQAAHWCSDVRKVLTLRSDSWFKKKNARGKSTGESRDLEAAWSQVNDRLKDLEKSAPALAMQWAQGVRETFAAMFDAGESRDLARALTLELREIDARLAHVTSPPDKEDDALSDLAKVQAANAQDMATILATAFAAAEQRLAELRLHDHDAPHLFSSELAQLIVSARNQQQANDPLRALKELAKVEQVFAGAQQRSGQFLDCRERLSQAVERWWDIADWAAGVSPETYRIGGRTLETAQDEFGAGHYPQALAGLESLDQIMRSLVQQMSPDDLDEYQKLRNAREAFAKVVDDAERTRDQLAALRGLDTAKVLATFDRLIGEADREVRSMSDSATVTARTERLSAELKQTVTNAKGVSKRIAEKCKSDLKSRSEWEQKSKLAEEALAAVLQLPGVSAEAEQLRQRISSARACIEYDAQPDPASGQLLSWGYTEALQVLKGYDDIRAAAVAKSAELLAASLPPELTDPVREIETALSELELVAPPVWSAVQRDEFREAVATIQDSLAAPEDRDRTVAAALATLSALRDRLAADIATRQAERTRAEEARLRASQSLLELGESGVPTAQYAVEARQLEETQAAEFAEREWTRAADNFEAIVAAAVARRAKFQQYGAEWAAARKVVENAAALAPKLLSWPPAASAANSALEAVRGVRQALAKTGDLEAALQVVETTGLRQRYDDLLAIAMKVPIPADQAAILKQLEESGGELRDACHELRGGLLRKLAKKLTKLVNPRANELHESVEKIERAWDDFRDQFFLELSRDEQFELDHWRSRIVAHVNEALEEVRALHDTARELLADDQKLATFKTAAKQAETLTLGQEPDAKFGQLFQTLAMLGEDAGRIDGARNDFAQALLIKADKSDSKERAKALADLEAQLLDRINALRGAEEVSRAATHKQRKKLSNDLKRRAKRNPDFEAYHEQLEAKLADAESLLDADDPYLAAQAQDMLNELEPKIAELSKSTKKGGVSYRPTEKLIDKLSGQLGADTDRIVSKYLPDTYALLHRDLNAAVVAARASGPAEAFEIISAIAPRIEQAVNAATKRKDDAARLKERIRELTKRWDALCATLIETNADWIKAPMIDPVPSLEKYVMARFDEAQAEMKRESGATVAENLLNDVAKMLAKFEASADKPAAIRQQDAACAQDQRQVRDLARQFNAEMEVIEKQLIPSVEAKLKSMENGDEKLTHGLTRILDNAKSIVKPYRNILAKSPLASKEKAPRMDKAMADFRSAYSLLGQLRTSANRMLEHSATTNVTDTGSLKKVQGDWVAQATHMTKTLRDAAAAIRAMLGEVRNLSGDESLSDDDLSKLEKDVKLAAGLIDKLASRFRADLFHTDFHSLRSKNSDDRKQAREQILRRMREVRTEVLQNPLLAKLRSDQNPFGGDKIMAALAYVRASLKRIELAALQGV